MSTALDKPERKNKKLKHKKKGHQEEEMPVVLQSMKDVEFPGHITQVNYFSLDALQNNLEDEMTSKAYYEAIMQNQHLFAGKIILHITQGINCLYSILAVQAGAQKVYCVLNGQSEREVQNIYMMKEIVKQNDLQDFISIKAWKQFNAEVDVIICEPMGYCLHFDGMLDRIIQARDLYLSKSGIMLPNILSFKCSLIQDQYFSDHKVNYWNDVYGIPMVSMKKWISHEPIIRVVDPNLIVSKVTRLLTFDIEKVTYEEIIKINKVVQIDLLGPCKVNGLVIWFQTFFSHCSQKIDIKASPWAESTKYTQVTLYWPDAVQYNGGKLRVRIKGQKNPKQGYSLLTTEIDDKAYQYCFS